MTFPLDTPSPFPVPLEAVPSLEAIELELALQIEDPVENGFEQALSAALDRVGGQLFFQMRVDTMPNCQRVAAASVGDGEDRQLVLIIQPDDGTAIRVETASEQAGPMAGLARSYAQLMQQF